MKPVVFLGLPRLGQVEPESCVAAFVTGASDRFSVMAQPYQSSLLAGGFNALFCQFLNGMYPYFALLHADVYPHSTWIDTMIDAMEKRNCSVIHACVAIKDNRGLTSTAVGDPEDPWNARRLTTREVCALPEVFNIADVTRLVGPPFPKNPCLLPNTGCMILKRGEWCSTFPGFTITDRIVRNGLTASAETEPEDWAFGRWCAKNSLMVLGTRLVKVEHFGRASYPNNEGWGSWRVDEHYIGRHALNYNGGHGILSMG